VCACAGDGFNPDGAAGKQAGEAAGAPGHATPGGDRCRGQYRARGANTNAPTDPLG